MLTTAEEMPKCFKAFDPEVEADLCELLGVEPETWDEMKSLLQSGEACKRETRKNKSGKGKDKVFHKLAGPVHRINRAVLDCILSQADVHSIAHGAHRGTDPVTCARRHAGFGKVFYVIDVQNALKSIDRKKLNAYLVPALQGAVAELLDLDAEDETDSKTAKKVVEALLQLMMVDNQVVAGIPTSPALLHRAFYPADQAVAMYLKLAEADNDRSFRVTRYNDCYVISTDADDFPRPVRKKLRSLVKNAGWKPRRTRLMRYGESESEDPEESTIRPVVSGLVVHDDGDISIPRWKLKIWREFMVGLLKKDELSRRDRAKLRGIIVFSLRVYDDELPRMLRQPYLDIKAKFHIGDRCERISLEERVVMIESANRS